MSRSIKGEVVIVTGASSGIGAATALELGRRGAKVALAARHAAELTGVAQAIKQSGGEALPIPTDVTAPQQIERLVRQVIEAYGRVDVLVNNAGIGASGKVAEMPAQEFVQVVYANLLGPMLLTRAVLPGMVARRHGAIVSVASVAGHVAIDPLYSATKFGIRGFSLSLRRELHGTGVSASVVSPGFIRTPMTARRRGRMPGPEVIARAIARLIVHPRREVIVPGYYAGAVWVERLFPWLVDRAT
jgi:NAD(P)-dependent dehydrogenase (short-subunit alcohol dehydrogenase family)